MRISPDGGGGGGGGVYVTARVANTDRYKVANIPDLEELKRLPRTEPRKRPFSAFQ